MVFGCNWRYMRVYEGIWCIWRYMLVYGIGVYISICGYMGVYREGKKEGGRERGRHGGRGEEASQPTPQTCATPPTCIFSYPSSGHHWLLK